MRVIGKDYAGEIYQDIGGGRDVGTLKGDAAEALRASSRTIGLTEIDIVGQRCSGPNAAYSAIPELSAIGVHARAT